MVGDAGLEFGLKKRYVKSRVIIVTKSKTIKKLPEKKAIVTKATLLT